MQTVALAPCFNPDTVAWESGYAEVPVWKGQPILLVPKAVARVGIAYDHQKYYRHHVLNFLRAEEEDAKSSLVHTLKSGRRVVYKKDLQRKYPCTKDFLYRFSREHPEVLGKYRAELAALEAKGRSAVVPFRSDLNSQLLRRAREHGDLLAIRCRQKQRNRLYDPQLVGNQHPAVAHVQSGIKFACGRSEHERRVYRESFRPRPRYL